MFSGKLSFCLFFISEYISAYSDWDLNEAFPQGLVTWSVLGKQILQAKEVYCDIISITQYKINLPVWKEGNRLEASKWPVLSESNGKREECEKESKGVLQRPADQS